MAERAISLRVPSAIVGRAWEWVAPSPPIKKEKKPLILEWVAPSPPIAVVAKADEGVGRSNACRRGVRSNATAQDWEGRRRTLLGRPCHWQILSDVNKLRIELSTQRHANYIQPIGCKIMLIAILYTALIVK